MYAFKNTTSKKSRGVEFLKIYGLTLVTAFVLMVAFRYRINHTPTSYASQTIEQSEPCSPPVASFESLLPLQNLQEIFVNLSF
ncbi:MAG: hypothetical protein AAFZ15_29740 [Bacteroidota bacterium]